MQRRVISMRIIPVQVGFRNGVVSRAEIGERRHHAHVLIDIFIEFDRRQATLCEF